ncbi:MAG: hypothetical protein ABIS14_10125, partial [Sphingomonas sp.]
MKIGYFVVTTCLALLSSATMAQAQVQPKVQMQVAGHDCRIRMETARTNWVIRNYDPFSTTAVPIDEFDVTFVNEGADTCSLRPIFDLENEAFGLD